MFVHQQIQALKHFMKCRAALRVEIRNPGGNCNQPLFLITAYRLMKGRLQIVAILVVRTFRNRGELVAVNAENRTAFENTSQAVRVKNRRRELEHLSGLNAAVERLRALLIGATVFPPENLPASPHTPLLPPVAVLCSGAFFCA